MIVGEEPGDGHFARGQRRVPAGSRIVAGMAGRFLHRRVAVLTAYHPLLWAVWFLGPSLLATVAALARWRVAYDGGSSVDLPLAALDMLPLWLALVAAAIVVPLIGADVTGSKMLGVWRRFVFEQLAVSRRRVRIRNTRIDWPAIAAAVGWATPDGSGGHQVPTIVAMSEDPETDVVDIEVTRTAGLSDPDAAGRSTHRLGAEFTAAASPTFTQTATSARFSVPRRPLPDYVSFTGMPRSTSWSHLHLGLRSDTKILMHRFDQVPHLMVAGVTGGGKGSVLRLAILHGFRLGWRVVVFNPKGSGEYQWAASYGVPVVRAQSGNRADYRSSEILARALLAEMGERQQAVEAAGLNNWTQLPDADTWSPVMVVVDEATNLLVKSPDKAIRDSQQVIASALVAMAQMGRSAGVHLVMASQRPDVAALGGDGAGMMRDNFGGRLAVRHLERQGLQMMFGERPDVDVTSLDGHPGRAIATGLAEGMTDVVRAQIAHVPDETVAGELPVDMHPVVEQGMPDVVVTQ